MTPPPWRLLAAALFGIFAIASSRVVCPYCVAFLISSSPRPTVSRGFRTYAADSPPSTTFLRSSSPSSSSFPLSSMKTSEPPPSTDPWGDHRPKYNISLLLIDHYDSFTYNLYDYFAQLLVEPPMVIAKDAYDEFVVSDWSHMIDAIVLSPGPGTPHEQPPLSHQAISRNPNLPILGVCLGHQLLALQYGARVDKAPTPIHGQDHWISQEQQLVVLDECIHDHTNNNNNNNNVDDREDDDESTTTAPKSSSSSSLLFQGLPSSFRVVRYHSLAVYDLPTNNKNDSVLQVTARSKGDNVIQAMQHTTHPHYGVQFHPESIGTQHGMALLENFLKIVELHKTKNNDDPKMTRKEQQQQHDEHQTIDQEEESSSSTSSTTPQKDAAYATIESTESSSSSSSPRFRVVAHPFQVGSSSSSSSSSSSTTPEQVFEALYRQAPHSMWLDSSSASTSRGELDILAAPMSSRDIIEYYYYHNRNNGQEENENENEDDITDADYSVDDILTRLEQELFGSSTTTTKSSTTTNANRRRRLRRPASQELAILHQLSGPIVFERENKDAALATTITKSTSTSTTAAAAARLPFDYRGGFLGYLGYEVRYDTEQYLHRVEGGRPIDRSSTTATTTTSESSDTPTAAFFLARNSLVYHHPTQTWYMISLVEENEKPEDVLEWMKTTKERILRLASSSASSPDDKVETQTALDPSTIVAKPLQFTPNRSKETYEKDIARCHEFIRQGDSYELCLTNQLEAHLPPSNPPRSTWDLYKILRRRNPAPYSAYFRWRPSDDASKNKCHDLTICCSSPERFMSVKRKQLHPEVPMVLEAEAKPIKGTEARVLPQNGVCLSETEEREDQRRARSLELSLKNRAENLMIVDLLRNDMSRVCQVGSVHVAKLMAIESFATVHQMVSTIRGTLATVNDEQQANGTDSTTTTTSSNSIDLLRAAFPGGSMTGAPKIRTMELLEDLEQNVDRGPYAGSLGYLSVNGCMDMNIIIRSAVVTTSSSKQGGGQRVRIGAGGAITALSDTQDEYEEMLLKARAVVQAVQAWAAEPIVALKPTASGTDVESTAARSPSA